jgi:uncharacterized protein (TIGR02421 family)
MQDLQSEPLATADRALTDIEKEIDLLLSITPVNADEAWKDFEKSGFSNVPSLRSRPLAFDPDNVKRRLYDLDVEAVDDQVIRQILREKRDEISRQITLLEDRDTSRFRLGSLQLFGEVGDALVNQANALLEQIDEEMPRDERVTARAFADRAEEELQFYRSRYEGFDHGLEIRDDVPDLMVRHGRLLIGAAANFRSRRVDALIQHEVGTHVVTYANGSAQPLKLFAVGLPSYEETQEGLAVLAEYAVGGLDPHRLRLLAGRVIAVSLMLQGAGFLNTFEELRTKYSFSPRIAWSVTIRVARSGGLTKDVIYLRGIARVLEFIAERKDLLPLFVGKLSLDHVPLVDELVERGVLLPARIRPRWLEMPGARERLDRAFEGLSVLDLVEAS